MTSTPPTDAERAAEAMPPDEAIAAARHICSILDLARMLETKPREQDIIQMARDIAKHTAPAKAKAVEAGYQEGWKDRSLYGRIVKAENDDRDKNWLRSAAHDALANPAAEEAHP